MVSDIAFSIHDINFAVHDIAFPIHDIKLAIHDLALSLHPRGRWVGAFFADSEGGFCPQSLTLTPLIFTLLTLHCKSATSYVKHASRCALCQTIALYCRAL